MAPPANLVSSGVEVANNQNCGFGTCRPKWLQRFRTTKWILACLCLASAAQGMSVNGLVNVVISSIEKRYGLQSSQSGLIAGGYDIASFICLVPVSYYGGQEGRSKPLWIGIGVLLVGVGSLLFALPHLIVGVYHIKQQELYVCKASNHTHEDSCSNISGTTYRQSLVLCIFVLSQLITGVGGAPLCTIAVSYIDENVSKRVLSMYLSVYNTASVIGPALGFWLGAETLKYYIDFRVYDPAILGLTSNSKVWVGAWWLGFVICGAVCIAIVPSILALPRSVPGSNVIRIENITESEMSCPARSFTKLREMPAAFRNLMNNHAYTFFSLAAASESFLVSGFMSFLPKIIENEYSISASYASILVGLVTIPAAGSGFLIGGFIGQRWSLSREEIQKLCIGCTFAGIILTTLIFPLYCPNPKFAGLNTPYFDSNSNDNLDAPCNVPCHCNIHEWEPICGVDGIMYFSPCYAGCAGEHMLPSKKTFSNCSCIKRYTEDIQRHSSTPYDAENIICESKCGKLWLFITVSFFLSLCTFISAIPALSATLRYVRHDQRTFALGVQWMVVRMLGTVPGPLAFGAIIDRACTLWEIDECGNSGSCLVYDNNALSRNTVSILIVGKFCTLFFLICSWKMRFCPASSRPT